MSLHQDLLDLARLLARHEPRRPKQSSLRRAVSTAYYAVFHLLVSEASGLFVRDEQLKATLNRVYTHAEMAKVAKAFSTGNLPKRLGQSSVLPHISPDLKTTARAFVELQQARHEADYDTARAFTRDDTLTIIDLAAQAFEAWARVKKEDCSRLFLASFLTWDRWDKGM